MSPTDTTLVVGGGHRFGVNDLIQLPTGEMCRVVESKEDTISVIRNVPADPDYEAAKELIREVASAQDQETLPP